MSPAVVSLVALLAVVLLSCTSRVNVGLVAFALSWVVGVAWLGMKPDAVMAAFPVSLFLTIAGVTFLFALAQENGTLEALTHQAVRAVGGRVAFLPLAFFVVAFVVSAVGPGAIASTALVAPLALVVGARAGIPAFLSVLMIGNGANAGNLSPVSAVGVVVNDLMSKVGLGGHETRVFLANFAAHTVVATAAYLLFGGRTLLKRTGAHAVLVATDDVGLTSRHAWTIGVIVSWIAFVVLAKAPIGLTAFAAATIIVFTKLADERIALRNVPWGVIIMVTGMGVLVGLLEKTGGMDLFTSLLAHLAGPKTVNGMIAFVTGIISSYSSTIGVVYPTFLPTVPGLVAKVGGGNPLAVALSINVGAAVVDVSPLSTIGALGIAALPASEDAPVVFRKLLLWGFSMAIVGAILCELFAPTFAG